MKKVVAGVGLLISGAILVLATFSATAGAMAMFYSWDTRLGRFWSAMFDSNLTAVFVIAVLLMLAGVYMICSGCRFGEGLRSVWGDGDRTEKK